jgi:uncharacterized protein (DUF1810 family)
MSPDGSARHRSRARANPHNASVTHDLSRFVEAPAGIYDGVLAELRRGRKTSHWMWFVFPQIAGLGQSWISRQYAIASLEEAREYLAHPILGPRLLEGTSAVLAAPASSAEAIFGGVDAMKLRSSMTLFLRAAPGEIVFRALLDRFWGGVPDPLTDEILGR